MQAACGYDWHVAESPVRRDAISGCARIQVVGNSGTGKSTLADKLGEIFGYPVLHLDEVHWQPNWRTITAPDMRDKVQNFIESNENWIIDGNYEGRLGDLTMTRATCIVWLDPPFALYFPRLLIRTSARLFGFRPPCSPGCHESLSDIFSRGEKSIVWFTWNNHIPKRIKYTHKMQIPGEENGGKWIRLGGWGGELEAWFSKVESSKINL